MSNITSLQIRQKKKIEIGNYKYISDIYNYEFLYPTFENKTIGSEQFYCGQYTPTEDGYVEFLGDFSSSPRRIYVVDITDANKNIFIHNRFHSTEYVSYQYIDDQLFMQKGHTYEYRTQGYTNPYLIKFGVKEYLMN